LFEKHRKELQKEIREKTHGLDMDKARIPHIHSKTGAGGNPCKLHGHIILCPG
jgi:hypothetical protein